jgi:membrane-associated phospholipid phosphatase
LTYVVPIPLGLGTYIFWRRNTSWRRAPNSAPRTSLVPETSSADADAGVDESPTPAVIEVIREADEGEPLDVHTATAERLTVERESSPGAGRFAPEPVRWVHSWWLAVLSVAALAVLGLAAWPVDEHTVAGWEQGVFRVVNDRTFLPFFLVWPVMQLGNLLVVPLSGLVALAFRRFRLGAALLIGGLLVYWLAKVVKHEVMRGRPATLLPHVEIHGTPSLGLGFPSGHAAVAALIATVCWFYLSRRFAVVVVILAVLVGLARIWVGAHLPLDVVAGAALGCSVGFALVFAFGRPVAAEGREPADQAG